MPCREASTDLIVVAGSGGEYTTHCVQSLDAVIHIVYWDMLRHDNRNHSLYLCRTYGALDGNEHLA